MFTKIIERVKKEKKDWKTSISTSEGSNPSARLHLKKGNHNILCVRYDGEQNDFSITGNPFRLEHGHLSTLEKDEKNLDIIEERLFQLMKTADGYYPLEEEKEKPKNTEKDEEAKRKEWADSIRNKSMNILQLSDFEDTYIHLVEDSVFNWIIGENKDEKEKEEALTILWNELHEADQKEHGSKHEFYEFLSRFTDDNDRALQISGECFYSLKEAMDFILKNNITIKETYEGYMY